MAQPLPFKVLQQFRAPHEGAPTSTKVLGYFNPHEYPLSLHLPELNRTLLIQAKKYITMEVLVEFPDKKQGKQRINVNDPLLENYVGPGKLAKTESKEEVPITWVTRPEFAPTPTNAVEYAGTNNFKTDARGNVIGANNIRTIQTGVAASHSSVTGYRSVEAAVKARAIRPAPKMVEDKTDIRETIGTNPAARQRPPTAPAPAQGSRRQTPVIAAPAPNAPASSESAEAILSELTPASGVNDAPIEDITPPAPGATAPGAPIEEIEPGDVPTLPPVETDLSVIAKAALASVRVAAPVPAPKPAATAPAPKPAPAPAPRKATPPLPPAPPIPPK